MIENFPNQRRMHCETGVLVNIMQYYGYNITERMVFGIGGGMYFLYFPLMKVQNFVLVTMRTKPGSIIRNFAKRMKINYNEMTFGNNIEKGTRVLNDLVDKNIPVVLASNILGIKYLNDLGFEMDYNGHHLIVIGKEGDNYIIADIDEKLPNDDYVYLNETNLKYARFRSGLSAPHGRLFYFDPLPKGFSINVDLRPAIITGLKDTCNNMSSIPFKYFGSKGIHYFAKDLRTWHKKYTNDRIDYNLLWYYRLIEQAGTGGAGYRYIYADFLKEASSLLQSEILENCSITMNNSADCWRQFTVNCNRYINRQNISLEEMADIIDEAGNYEYETFNKIQNKYLSKHK